MGDVVMPISRDDLKGRSCWIFSDGKAGNDVQSLGVANALELDVTIKRVEPTGIHKLLSPWIGVAHREHFGRADSVFSRPWPDVAIAIGRLTTPYIRELKRLAGDASFTVILLGVAISTAVFLARVWQTGFLANYRDYRANLGRGILIGLELLIAADILKSVVVDPTLQGIAVLGGIVAIRTFLSISLDVEINGHWPWETTRLAQQADTQETPGPA